MAFRSPIFHYATRDVSYHYATRDVSFHCATLDVLNTFLMDDAHADAATATKHQEDTKPSGTKRA